MSTVTLCGWGVIDATMYIQSFHFKYNSVKYLLRKKSLASNRCDIIPEINNLKGRKIFWSEVSVHVWLV